MVGGEGSYFKAAASIPPIGRLAVVAMSVGAAQAAYDLALKFAKERNLYGKPIANLQAIRFMLVDMSIEIKAARWLCYNAAWLSDQNALVEEINIETAGAKLYATEVAVRTCLSAIRIMGAAGTCPEYGVIHALLDSLENLASAGTQEVMKVIVGRGITS